MTASTIATDRLELVTVTSPDGTPIARLGMIEAPVLLVVGELTEPRRREMWERLAGVFKNLRIAVLPGQRHAVHQTAPELLAAALEDFLLA